MAKLVKRFDADVKEKGDTIHVPHLSNFTAADKSAETEVTFQATTESKTDISIDQHKCTPFMIEDIHKVQSAYALLKEYTSKAAESINRAVDNSLMALYSGLSQQVGDYGVDITKEAILRANQYLDDADAPDTERYCVVKPSAKKVMLDIDNFINAAKIPLANMGPIKTGRLIGEYYGVKFYVTTNVHKTSGTPDEVHNLLFQKEAFALAMQKGVRVQSQYFVNWLGTAVVVDILYGVKEYRDAFGVLIKT